MKKSKKSLSLGSMLFSNKTTKGTSKDVPRQLCFFETLQRSQANMKLKECPLLFRKTRQTSRLQCLPMKLAAPLSTRKCLVNWLNSWIWTKRARKWPKDLTIRENQACQRSREASSKRARQRLFSSLQSSRRKVAACCSGHRRDPRHFLHLPWHSQHRILLHIPSSSSIQFQMKAELAT